MVRSKVAFFIMLAFATPAVAQQQFNMIDWNAIQFNNLLLQDQANSAAAAAEAAQIDLSAEEQAFKDAAVAALQAEAARRGEAAPGIDGPLVLTYTRDDQISRMVIDRIAGEMSAINPADGDALRAALAQVDVFALIQAEAQKLGVDSQNIADAMALWSVNAWMIINRDDRDPDPLAVQAVSAQMAEAMQLTGVMKQASNSMRQELAEELLLRAVIASEAYEGLKATPDALVTLDAQLLKATGDMDFDLAAMDLTDAGFVARQ